MAELRVMEALSTGLERSFHRSSMVLVGIFFLLGLSNVSTSRALDGALQNLSGAAIDLPVAAYFSLSTVTFLLTLAATVVAVRTLESGSKDSIPREHFTRDMFRAMTNTLVGQIVVSIPVLVGVFFFLLPSVFSSLAGLLFISLGVYVVVSLLFWLIFVTVENHNFVEAFRNSWEMTGGKRPKLFLLTFFLFIFILLLNGVAVLIGFAVPQQLLTDLVVQGISAFSTVLGISVVVAAYHQLKEKGTSRETSPGSYTPR